MKKHYQQVNINKLREGGEWRETVRLIDRVSLSAKRRGANQTHTPVWIITRSRRLLMRRCATRRRRGRGRKEEEGDRKKTRTEWLFLTTLSLHCIKQVCWIYSLLGVHSGEGTVGESLLSGSTCCSGFVQVLQVD